MSASPIVPDDLVPFTKAIIPVWKRRGRRYRLIGYTARLNADVLLVPGSLITPRLFNRTIDAERALDEAALDLIAEAATTADLQALPFEPTAYELAQMQAQAACEIATDDRWPEADTQTSWFGASNGAVFRVTTLTPVGEQ